MSNELVKKINKRFKALDVEKKRIDSTLKEIAKFTQPHRNDFITKNNNSDEVRDDIFDSTAEESLANLTAELHSLLFNPAHTWFELDVLSTEAREDVTTWLDEVTRLMIEKFSASTTNFHTSANELLSETSNLGTGVLFEDEEDEEIRVFNIPLSQVRLAENKRGVVDTMFRCFEMSAVEIFDKYGKSVELPESVKEAEENDPDKKFKVIHAVYPRRGKDYDPDSLDPKKYKYASVYYLQTDEFLLSESGYVEQPFQAPRWRKNTGDTYGVGLGHTGIPTVRALNDMQRSLLIATDKQADPTTLIPDDGFLGPYSSQGGAINFYRSTTSMKDRIITLGSDANLGAIQAIIESYQHSVRRNYLNDKLQMFGGPQMTATEVIHIEQQKMRLLGPIGGRFEVELLESLIERVFGLMYRRGEFPEIPEGLQASNLKVRYISPITRAQKQTEAQAFNQAVSYLAPLVQTSPEMLQNFNFDEVARDTQNLFGYPQKYLYEEKKVQETRQAQAQAQQQAEAQEQAQAQAELNKTNAEVSNVKGQKEN